MPYIVKVIHLTDKQYSVDGKEHRVTLYYQGVRDNPFRTVVFDRGKKTAAIFEEKSDAQRFARRYCEIFFKIEVIKIC